MLPPKTILKVSKQILYWRNPSFWFSEEEAQVLYQTISRILADPLVTRMIIDNRKASGSWTSSIEAMWEDLIYKLSAHFDICATLESELTAGMLNQFSKDSGVLHKVRSFVEPPKALAFVGIYDPGFLTKLEKIVI